MKISGYAVKNYISGTITECAFDAININYATKTIKYIRIGNGENRTISYDTTTYLYYFFYKKTKLSNHKFMVWRYNYVRY